MGIHKISLAALLGSRSPCCSKPACKSLVLLDWLASCRVWSSNPNCVSARACFLYGLNPGPHACMASIIATELFLPPGGQLILATVIVMMMIHQACFHMSQHCLPRFPGSWAKSYFFNVLELHWIASNSPSATMAPSIFKSFYEGLHFSPKGWGGGLHILNEFILIYCILCCSDKCCLFNLNFLITFCY